MQKKQGHGEGNGNPTPVFMPGKGHGRSLAGCVPWGYMTEQRVHVGGGT